MQTFTVGEMAERIKRPDEATEAAIYRLQNWTKEKIIQPIDETRPGTGKRRLYSRRTLIDALMVQLLTDATGMPALKVAPELERLRKYIPEERESGVSVIVIGTSPGSEQWSFGPVKFSGIGKYIANSEREIHVVVDLHKFYARLEGI
jgi:DNA-binding transcriptional MerR regulator